MYGCISDSESNITNFVITGKALYGTGNNSTNHVHNEITVTGPEYNMTQVEFKKKPDSKKYNWINTTLVLVMTVFALVSLAYLVMQIVEKNMKRKANV